MNLHWQSLVQSVHAYLEQSSPSSLVPVPPGPYVHERHVCRQSWQRGQELRNLLAEVADVANVSELPGAWGVHLNQRVHQREDHLFMIGQRCHCWRKFLHGIPEHMSSRSRMAVLAGRAWQVHSVAYVDMQIRLRRPALMPTFVLHLWTSAPP